MKRIILFVFLILGFSTSAFSLPFNECKTDIYFGNGVWNKQFSNDNCVNDSAADCSRAELNDLIKEEIIKGDPALAAKYGTVKLQYNWGQGRDIDLVETFYQLKEVGQLSGREFFALMDVLVTKRAADLSGEDLKTMRDILLKAIAMNEQSNVDEMLQKYYNESFKLGHRVLLVSHSQGNLFANRVYDSINPQGYRDYFANVQVASVASSVHAKMGEYITASEDWIVRAIPGSMKPNATLDFLAGHQFVAAYLDSEDTYKKIVTAIKRESESLDKAPSQWQTDQEIDKGTCDYRITVKHRFDPALTITEKVYPFAPNQKLYRALDRADGTMAYVKATCGGQAFTDSWENKGENECLAIDNPPREKITTQARFNPGHNYSSFLPDNLQDPVGTIDDSTGCATAHIPEGWITFYRLKSGDDGCVPDYTFAYEEGQIYTCLPADYFEMIGSIRTEEFLKQAAYTGTRDICGGSNSSWYRKSTGVAP